MALHYIHVSNGTVTLDNDGTDLPDLASVKREAGHAARDLLHLSGSATEELWATGPWKVWVTDEPKGAGRTIVTIEIRGM